MRMAAYQLALDGGFALLFLLLVVVIATKLDRFEHKRGNHNDYGNDLEVRHDLTSSTFVFGGEKPSAICFLPAGSPRASLLL